MPDAALMSERWRHLPNSVRHFAIVALVTAFATPMAMAAPPPLALRYEVSASGLSILTLDFQISESADGYDVAGLIHTSGLLGLLSNFTLWTESRGAVAADTLHPTVHDSSSYWRAKERRAHLDYSGGGKVRAALTPPEDPDRPAPSPEQIVGTVDPLTAILSMSHAVARAGRCSANVPVYDGRRRYDLVLADDGAEWIGPSRAYAYSGTARRCTVDMIKIAGFSHDHDYAPRTNHGRVWIAAPRPSAPPLPVRVEFLSDWGPITVQMVKVNPAK